MNEIRPWLYIGKYRDTLNAHLLSAYQIEAMLQLAELVEHPGRTSLYLPVEDGVTLPENLLRQGVDFVIAQKNMGHIILIACGAGISRSAAFCVAVLKEVESLSLIEALRLVKQKHPPAMPHPELWTSLCTYYNEDISFFDAHRMI